MSRERRARIDRLFEQALEIPAEDRAAYLQDACSASADQGLFREVASLLRSHDRAASFLEKPAGESLDELLSPEAVPDSAPALSPGELFAGRFEIRQLRDRGGMGDVYEAFDRALKDPVALKTIRPEIATNVEAVARFKEDRPGQESHASQRVPHS